VSWLEKSRESSSLSEYGNGYNLTPPNPESFFQKDQVKEACCEGLLMR
jgi:hypothetical protein